MSSWVLQRSLLESEAWTALTPNERCVLIALLVLADHTTAEWQCPRCGMGSSVPGKMTSSRSMVQAKAAVSGPRVVRRALEKLEAIGFIGNQSKAKCHTLIILTGLTPPQVDDVPGQSPEPLVQPPGKTLGPNPPEGPREISVFGPTPLGVSERSERTPFAGRPAVSASDTSEYFQGTRARNSRPQAKAPQSPQQPELAGTGDEWQRLCEALREHVLAIDPSNSECSDNHWPLTLKAWRSDARRRWVRRNGEVPKQDAGRLSEALSAAQGLEWWAHRVTNMRFLRGNADKILLAAKRGDSRPMRSREMTPEEWKAQEW